MMGIPPEDQWLIDSGVFLYGEASLPMGSECAVLYPFFVERIKEMVIVRLIIIIDNGIIRVYADCWLSGCLLVAVGANR